MPNPAALRRSASSSSEDQTSGPTEPSAVAPWLAVVDDKVKSMRFGVVQIVVHDSKVVQIERTERTRFEVPAAVSSR